MGERPNMISNSDLIVKMIENKGYTLASFIEKSGIPERTMYYAIEHDSWTEDVIEKVGKTLRVNLKSLANAKLGVVRDVNDRI